MIVAGVCWAAKLGFLNGLHGAEDEYRIALFPAAAELGPQTERYDPRQEVTGAGYFAGGQRLRGRRATLDDRVACLDFEDVTWPDSTIAAAGALIFNASRGDAALAVLSFGEERQSVNGPFTVKFPPPTKDQAVVRIG